MDDRDRHADDRRDERSASRTSRWSSSSTCQLAFDEKVDPEGRQLHAAAAATPRSSWAPAARASRLSLKIMLGLLKADGGEVWVNGERVDQLTELEMMEVRANLGMVFQEGALFDSLTVRENVGYQLYEETDSRSRRSTGASRKCSGSSGSPSTSTRCRRSCRADSAAASRSRARWRPSRAILLYDEATTGLDPITATTVDDEIIKLRDLEERQLDRRHPPAARRVLRRHQQGGPGPGRRRSGSSPADPEKEREAEFIMLRDGLIVFEGDAKALRESTDEYIQKFLS